MPQLSGLISLVSFISLAPIVSCRPADTLRFDLLGNIAPPVFKYPGLEESGEGQFLPIPDGDLAFSATPLLFPDTTDSNVPFDSFFSTSNLIVAEGTLCPGENRFAFCCEPSGPCAFTATCSTDAYLACCTLDPVTRDYSDCNTVSPEPSASTTPGDFNLDRYSPPEIPETYSPYIDAEPIMDRG